jgi:hypothetical protein
VILRDYSIEAKLLSLGLRREGKPSIRTKNADFRVGNFFGRRAPNDKSSGFREEPN